MSAGRPACTASYEGHTDWVTGLALAASGDALASCSSDTTVKLWRSSGASSACLHTFTEHRDYVTCLAVASQQQHQLHSAGLRGEVFRYDLQVGSLPPGWRGKRAHAGLLQPQVARLRHRWRDGACSRRRRPLACGFRALKQMFTGPDPL